MSVYSLGNRSYRSALVCGSAGDGSYTLSVWEGQIVAENNDLQMLRPRITLSATFLGTFKFLIETLPASAPLSRWATLRTRRMTIRTVFHRRCLTTTPFFILRITDAASAPPTAFIFWIHLRSSLESRVLYLSHGRCVHLRHQTVCSKGNRGCWEEGSHSPQGRRRLG